MPQFLRLPACPPDPPALENQATIETLRRKCAWFEDLRGQLKVSTAEVARSVDVVRSRNCRN